MTKWNSMWCVLLVFGLASCGGKEDVDAGTEAPGRSVAVTLAEAGVEEVRLELFSVGRVVSRNTPTLSAEINARVVEVLVEEGQRVRRGEALILLDKTTFELARREAAADIQRLTGSIENEQRRVARYRDLKTREMMPQERLDDAEATLAVDQASLAAAEARLAITQDRLAKTELDSPVDGVVERRHVSVGDYVQVAGPLVTLTDTVNLRVELPFPETVGHLVKEGQPIRVESPIAPGLLVDATISQIRPQVGMMSRSLLAIADLTNPGSWRPEATVEGILVVETHPNAVVVPGSSVIRRPAGDVVYRVESADADRVAQVVVKPGVRMNGRVEILEGIQPGDLVVVNGAHYLTDGARITVRESSGE